MRGIERGAKIVAQVNTGARYNSSVRRWLLNTAIAGSLLLLIALAALWMRNGMGSAILSSTNGPILQGWTNEHEELCFSLAGSHPHPRVGEITWNREALIETGFHWSGTHTRGSLGETEYAYGKGVVYLTALPNDNQLDAYKRARTLSISPDVWAVYLRFPLGTLVLLTFIVTSILLSIRAYIWLQRRRRQRARGFSVMVDAKEADMSR